MADLDRERLTWMFTQMVRIREFEERVKRTFEDHPGVIRGHTHLADGLLASVGDPAAVARSSDPRVRPLLEPLIEATAVFRQTP